MCAGWGECLPRLQARSGLSSWNTENTVSQYKETWSRMKVTVSIAYCPCILDGETHTLDTVLCIPQVSLITPGWTSLPWGCWGGNLEKHSCKCKSWAMWAFSTLPAICGEKEFLNYVNQRGRVGTLLCLYSCSPAPAPQSFMGWRYLRICWERVF